MFDHKENETLISLIPVHYRTDARQESVQDGCRTGQMQKKITAGQDNSTVYVQDRSESSKQLLLGIFRAAPESVQIILAVGAESRLFMAAPAASPEIKKRALFKLFLHRSSIKHKLCSIFKDKSDRNLYITVAKNDKF